MNTFAAFFITCEENLKIILNIQSINTYSAFLSVLNETYHKHRDKSSYNQAESYLQLYSCHQ